MKKPAVKPVGVLPAYAGMIPERVDEHLNEVSAPRVCGDDPCWNATEDTDSPCSPRMRG